MNYKTARKKSCYNEYLVMFAPQLNIFILNNNKDNFMKLCQHHLE